MTTKAGNNDSAEEPTPAVEVVADKRPKCPHCGSLLELHNDAEDNMHCRSAQCGRACCFAPSAAGPQLRGTGSGCPSLGR